MMITFICVTVTWRQYQARMKCPYCNAEKDGNRPWQSNPHVFSCGTHQYGNAVDRGHRCLLNEIAELRIRLSELTDNKTQAQNEERSTSHPDDPVPGHRPCGETG